MPTDTVYGGAVTGEVDMNRIRRGVLLTTALLGGLLVGAPAADAAGCVYVQSSGKESFGSTYTFKLASRCEGTTYVNYIFDNGSSGFNRQTTGFAAVTSFGSLQSVSLSGVAPGTYGPSVSWTEQGTYETGRASLSSYTIRDTSPLPGPSSYPSPYPSTPVAPAPSLPACGPGSLPTVTGSQTGLTSVTYTWDAIPGTSRYLYKEARYTGGAWVVGTDWVPTTERAFTYLSLNVGDFVSLYVYADCLGTIDTPPAPSVMVRDLTTPTALTPDEPTFDPALTTWDWKCSERAENYVCNAQHTYTSRKPLTKRQLALLRKKFIANAYDDLQFNNVTYLGAPLVTVKRPSKKRAVFTATVTTRSP